MTILGLLGAIATILGPVITAGLLAWIEDKRKDAIHATVDEADESIKKIVDGNPVGRAELARQLERLQREAKRKLRHP